MLEDPCIICKYGERKFDNLRLVSTENIVSNVFMNMHDDDAVEEMAGRFNKPQPGVTVIYSNLQGKIEEQLYAAGLSTGSRVRQNERNRK
ncbi:hypothetical protein V6N11_004628 [Hibiscus sabdariffa]|uniref:Uncharacterized protein n=1 Tax=Hibiscus sabdariffa TaxID=183260 RepID=A0ABR2SGT1_9ROSI